MLPAQIRAAGENLDLQTALQAEAPDGRAEAFCVRVKVRTRRHEVKVCHIRMSRSDLEDLRQVSTDDMNAPFLDRFAS